MRVMGGSQRAGHVTRPQETLTLTVSGNACAKHELVHYLHVLRPAA